MADKFTKISQAIRLGATFRPQSCGFFYNAATNESCVLGAAYEAVTGGPYIGYSEGQPDPYAVLSQRFGLPGDFLGQLAARNNGGESRESIADDLESQGL